MDNEAVKQINYFVTSVISAFTLFAGWRTAKFTYQIFQKKKNVKALESTQICTVEELKNKGSQVKDLVIVRGQIGTADGHVVKRPVTGWGTPPDLLALQLKFTEGMYSNDNFNLTRNNYVLNMTEALKNCTIEGSHKLTLWSESPSRQKYEIKLKNFDQRDFSKVLEIMQWKEQRRSLNIVQHINVLLLSILRALISYGGDDGTFIRGVEVGKREVEAGLRVGASVSILGTLTLTIDGESLLEVQQIFKDRLSRISELKGEIKNMIEGRNLWLLGTVIGSIYLGRRVFKFIKKHDIKVPLINP